MKFGIVLILIGIAWCVGSYRRSQKERYPKAYAEAVGGMRSENGIDHYVQYTLVEPSTGQLFTYNLYYLDEKPYTIRLISGPPLDSRYQGNSRPIGWQTHTTCVNETPRVSYVQIKMEPSKPAMLSVTAFDEDGIRAGRYLPISDLERGFTVSFATRSATNQSADLPARTATLEELDSDWLEYFRSGDPAVLRRMGAKGVRNPDDYKDD